MIQANAGEAETLQPRVGWVGRVRRRVAEMVRRWLVGLGGFGVGRVGRVGRGAGGRR